MERVYLSNYAICLLWTSQFRIVFNHVHVSFQRMCRRLKYNCEGGWQNCQHQKCQGKWAYVTYVSIQIISNITSKQYWKHRKCWKTPAGQSAAVGREAVNASGSWPFNKPTILPACSTWFLFYSCSVFISEFQHLQFFDLIYFWHVYRDTEKNVVSCTFQTNRTICSKQVV